MCEKRVRKRIYIFNPGDIGIHTVTDIAGTEDQWMMLRKTLHQAFREFRQKWHRDRNWAIVDLDTREYDVFGSHGYAHSIRVSFKQGGWRNQLVGFGAERTEDELNGRSMVEKLMPKCMIARTYRLDSTANLVWNHPGIERLLCLHLLSNEEEPGRAAAWTVMFCQAVLFDGRVVKAVLPFVEIPRGENSISFIQAHATRDKVDLVKIEFFKSIDNSSISAEFRAKAGASICS